MEFVKQTRFYITLYYITLHDIILLRYITLHYMTLYYNYITLQNVLQMEMHYSFYTSENRAWILLSRDQLISNPTMTPL